MGIRILVDMNLSPEWVPELAKQGWIATHWSTVGDPRADDVTLMSWAREHKHIVFTNDLDFGAMLACTRANGPSVIQVRGQNVLPETMGATVKSVVIQHELELIEGALIVVDGKRQRVRVLPLDR